MFASKDGFKTEYVGQFEELGKNFRQANTNEQYHALVRLLQKKIHGDWVSTNQRYAQGNCKEVYYFSLEFLIGKLLMYYLMSLGVAELVRKGLADLQINLDELCDWEVDAGLGNGGLGRLAACFLDSMAFLQIPGHGNGIRYRYGLFQQKIVDGFQAELPDNWLRYGYPWEERKPEKAVIVKFNGEVKTRYQNDRLTFTHENYESVLAVPYDIPMIGYGPQKNINSLRLWSAEPVIEDFDLASFHQGDYGKAVSKRSEIEAISYILYPEDNNRAGQELRLKQEYFFVAAGLGAIVQRYKEDFDAPWREFNTRVAIHINDTHPALCVPELMRILVDEEEMGWDEAWNITVNSISYTNHTILPEALEKWPVGLVQFLLPRIYMIIEEIDRRYRLETEIRNPHMRPEINSTAVIHDGFVWMANLAVIGSHSVNGVAQLHTEILKKSALRDFYKIFPYKFNNKTNGVSHRRFLLQANPGLSALITEAIGDDWINEPEMLRELLAYRQDGAFLHRLAEVKYQNKCRLARYIEDRNGVTVDPHSVFDVQVKRLHAYKRQLLSILRVMYTYDRLKEDPQLEIPPQTFIFSGKAAPGYEYAKLVIKLINTVAAKVNEDKDIHGKLKVVFLDNFRVSTAEMIYPAADVSEQISTASKEASGTGNMKFMMNGAITLGTLDGANVEIRQEVGDDNIVIFGLTAEQVLEFYGKGGYSAWDVYHDDVRIKTVLNQLIDASYLGMGADFRMIYDSLLRDNDYFFVLKDFSPYVEASKKINSLYSEPRRWQEMCLENIAKSGVFSSDRTIRQYAEDIWGIKTNR